MVCYKCGSAITGEDFCTACGADVKIYKRIIKLSNMNYNEGLERAKVRNLSGAVESLRKSLKYYKLNIQARNLLGLVYFEMGETVDALGEWVISRSILPEKNPAEMYLSAVQSNANKLEALNQTIKKYNQALTYCRQGSRDLAIIQLKKVLNLNPRMIKGHQLLALIYMEEGKYDLSQKSLRNARNIDSGNTMTLRYLKEVERFTRGESDSSKSKRAPRKEKEDVVSYQSGNETIISPTSFKDYSALTTIINILIGIGLGVLGAYFLLVPDMRQRAEREAAKSVQEASDTVSTKNQSIQSLENQVEALEQQIAGMEKDNSNNEDVITVYDKLLKAVGDAYVRIPADLESVGASLADMDPSVLTQEGKLVYDALEGKVNEVDVPAFYNEGKAAYNQQDYEGAVQKLQRVVDSDENYGGSDHKGNAMYLLAQSYFELEDYVKAKGYFEKFVELQPGTNRAATSNNRLSQIENMESADPIEGEE